MAVSCIVEELTGVFAYQRMNMSEWPQQIAVRRMCWVGMGWSKGAMIRERAHTDGSSESEVILIFR